MLCFTFYLDNFWPNTVHAHLRCKAPARQHLKCKVPGRHGIHRLCIEIEWDKDLENEDAKGVKLFKVAEKTEDFLNSHFSTAVSNHTYTGEKSMGSLAESGVKWA